MPAIIQEIGTFSPPCSLTQQEILALIKGNVPLSDRAYQLYERYLSDAGIHRRYFAADDVRALWKETVDEKMKRFEHWAVRLSLGAIEKVLKKGDSPARVDAVFVCTCTGYLCPGLSTYIIQQMGLSAQTHVMDLVGLGCTGAIPCLRAACDYLGCHPDSTVLAVAVEVCSAAIHWAQHADLILSNSIFSDGAAAVLLTNRTQASGLRIEAIDSILWPQFRDQLRFKYLDGRLCNVISPQVPQIAAEALELLYHRPLHGRADYAFHAGGRKVLDAIEERLRLSKEEMGPSRRILRDFGNMSSPSVLFVLKEILKQGLTGQGPVLCFSFGAGFYASLLRAQWQP